MYALFYSSKIQLSWGTWLAQRVECVSLDLRVVGSTPTLDVCGEYLKIESLKNKIKLVCIWELGCFLCVVKHLLLETI